MITIDRYLCEPGEKEVTFESTPESAYVAHTLDGDELHLFELKYIGTIKSKKQFDIKLISK